VFALELVQFGAVLHGAGARSCSGVVWSVVASFLQTMLHEPSHIPFLNTETNPMNIPRIRLPKRALHGFLAAGAAAFVAAVMAHGDVVPQAVDTHTLPQLGAKWLEANPYDEKSPARSEALRIGASAYNQNCARCHGLEAISGGMSPDLRIFDADCTGMADAAKQQACFKEMDDYFVATIRRGRVRDGRVYMPPFEGTLSQEAIWAIRTYIETRREK
jgi:cytochrome c-550 PedF